MNSSNWANNLADEIRKQNLAKKGPVETPTLTPAPTQGSVVTAYTPSSNGHALYTPNVINDLNAHPLPWSMISNNIVDANGNAIGLYSNLSGLELLIMVAKMVNLQETINRTVQHAINFIQNEYGQTLLNGDVVIDPQAKSVYDDLIDTLNIVL